MTTDIVTIRLDIGRLTGEYAQHHARARRAFKH